LRTAPEDPFYPDLSQHAAQNKTPDESFRQNGRLFVKL